MPIRKDGTGKRWVEMEFIALGTPEQVWQAMATGPGNTAWFTKTEIDEKVGGEIQFDFGSNGLSKGEVTTWQPPHQFGYVEHEWSEGAPPVATEITITSRSGDRCIVRMVHSLFSTTDDWDDQLEGFESGWPGFFEVLRVYLAHFAGKPGASIRIDADAAAGGLEEWSKIMKSLNLAGANVSERRESSARAPRFAGVIEHVHQDPKGKDVMIRLEQPCDGIALVGYYPWDKAGRIAISIYAYGAEAAKKADSMKNEWGPWLRDLLQG